MTHQVRHTRRSKFGKPFRAGRRFVILRKKYVYYPTVDETIKTNKRILENIKASRQDRFLITETNKEELASILREGLMVQGDIYNVATFLLKRLCQSHIFASGNRRTAYSIVQSFLFYNLGESTNFDRQRTTDALQGVREGYYSDAEIKHWLQMGEIL